MGEGGGADGGVSELQRLNANGVLFWDAAPAHHLEKWLDRWRSCIVPSLPCDRDVGTHHVDAHRSKLPKGQYFESGCCGNEWRASVREVIASRDDGVLNYSMALDACLVKKK